MSTSLCVTLRPSCVTCQRGLGGHRRAGSRTRVSSMDSEEGCAHFLRVPPAPVGPRDNLGDRACNSQCVPQECCVARCLTLTGAFSLTWTWSYFPVCVSSPRGSRGWDRPFPSRILWENNTDPSIYLLLQALKPPTEHQWMILSWEGVFDQDSKEEFTPTSEKTSLLSDQ